MPKETFFNLPDEKREMIENAATDEFAKYGYDNASINRIVDACKIAKGSFYQYFEDKKDLMRHLLNKIAEKKVEYLSPFAFADDKNGFFDKMRLLWAAGLKFANDNEKLAYLGNEMFKNQNRHIYNEVLEDNRDTATAFYKKMILSGIQKGELRADLDLEYVSYMFNALGVATIEYYFSHVLKEDMTFTKLDGKIMDTVDLFIDFAKNGLTPQK